MKVFKIDLPSAPKQVDYMRFQTINLLNEWQHYRNNSPSNRNQSLEQYITEKYNFTAKECYENYNNLISVV